MSKNATSESTKRSINHAIQLSSHLTESEDRSNNKKHHRGSFSTIATFEGSTQEETSSEGQTEPTTGPAFQILKLLEIKDRRFINIKALSDKLKHESHKLEIKKPRPEKRGSTLDPSQRILNLRKIPKKKFIVRQRENVPEVLKRRFSPIIRFNYYKYVNYDIDVLKNESGVEDAMVDTSLDSDY